MYTEEDLFKLLEKRYPEPEYVLMRHIRSTVNIYDNHSIADAIAMSTYPSRGLKLHGFEIKSYKNDLIREINNPEKAEKISCYMHYWWIVCPLNIIENINDIPDNWGVLVPKKEKLVIEKNAKELSPTIINYELLASFLRNLKKETNKDKEIQEAYQIGYKDSKIRAEYEYKKELEELNQSIKKFEEISGINIDKYNGEHIAQEIKEYFEVKHNIHQFIEKIKYTKNRAKKILEDSDSFFQAIDDFTKNNI